MKKTDAEFFKGWNLRQGASRVQRGQRSQQNGGEGEERASIHVFSSQGVSHCKVVMEWGGSVSK